MISLNNQYIYSTAHKRNENQDRCFAITAQSSPHKEQTMGIYAVCDGISQANGKEAVDLIGGSIYQMAGEFLGILPRLPYGDNTDERGLMQCDLIRNKLNEWLLRCDEFLRQQENCGTTASVSVVFDDCIYTANVGDSPVYLYTFPTEESGSDLKRLYTCQNEAGKLRLAGKLTEEEALRDPSKNHLLQAIGAASPLHEQDIAFHAEYLGAENILLLGSDGALAVFSEEKLKKLLDGTRNGSMRGVVNAVLEQVKQTERATDNFSLIAVQIGAV